jgi:hypothetical protein
MTRAEGNLVGEEVSVGDEVSVTRSMNALRVNTGEYYDLNPEQVLVVTRVYGQSLVARTADKMSVRGQYGGREMKRASFSIDRLFLTGADPSRRPRRLGQKPEDTDDITYIDKLDPGIQWLWEDLGRYATEQGYCPQYDALCAKIGIPGRPRDFSVSLDLNGVRFSATVQARSQREANERAQEAVNNGIKAEVIQ